LDTFHNFVLERTKYGRILPFLNYIIGKQTKKTKFSCSAPQLLLQTIQNEILIKRPLFSQFFSEMKSARLEFGTRPSTLPFLRQW